MMVGCLRSADGAPREGAWSETVRRTWFVASVACCLFVAVLFGPSEANAQVDIPPVPEGDHYILDEAGILSSDTMSKIGDIQERAAMSNKTQIVVVTINSKASYGAGTLSIEDFAAEWFNEWGIGIRRGGELYDRGILLLVSVGDRKARIELGREWGHRWDGYAQRVMSNMIVPQFKAGDYELGIVRGVDALGQMAQRGPSGSPPSRSTASRWLDNAKQWTRKTSVFSFETQLGLSAIGLILIVLSLFIKDEKRSRWCFWIGVGIVVLAVLTYVVLVIVALLTDSGDSDGSGGFSGGGGFGGGASGGGGATGSW